MAAKVGGGGAKADQIEAQVDGGARGTVGVDACQVYQVGAAAVLVGHKGDAAGGQLGTARLQVEQGVGVGQGNAAQERCAGVGVEQGHLKSIVRPSGSVVQRNAAEREA
ncbi:MAG: hypothetical protein RLZZ573_1298 [Pseudomonadota bacterium]